MQAFGVQRRDRDRLRSYPALALRGSASAGRPVHGAAVRRLLAAEAAAARAILSTV
jgi:hypothetical protein